MAGLIDLARFFAHHPLTKDAQFDAWGRFASWQIKSRLHEEVLMPWIAGQRLAVRRGMTGATGNLYAGVHEFADMMLLLHFIREGDLFLDIGANVGSYTVLASGVRKATTWAFEPDPDTARKLARNIELNDLRARVTVHELALGNADGETRFTVGLDCTNKVADEAETSFRLVRQQRLDTLIGDAQPSMIKMDVEGHEEAVLLGAVAVLARPSLKVIELETVTPTMSRLLAEQQFERAWYEPFSRALRRDAPKGGSANNTVFVRDWAFVAARLRDAQSIQVLGHSV